MLGKYWRLRMIQKTGQIMTFNNDARIAIRAMGWKMSSGELTYGTVIQEDLGFDAGETIADDGEVEGTVVDNSGTLLWGVNGTFTVTHDHTDADGECKLYLEYSDSDNNWPSTSDDFKINDLTLICALPIANTGEDKSRSKNFEI